MSTDAGDEPCDVYQHRMRRARKDHKCDACREVIPRGHLYFNVFSVFDGQSDTTKRCGRCETLYKALCKLHEEIDEGTMPDHELNCGHTYEDIFHKPPPPELAELAFLTPAEMQGRLLTLVKP